MQNKVVISNSKRTVTLNGQPISLADKEFNMLYYMAGKKGAVLKRIDIINSVWDSNVIERTVDVHVNKINKKLGKGFIMGVLKHGYKLEGDVRIDDDKVSEDKSKKVGFKDGVKVPWIYETLNSSTSVVTEDVVNTEYGKMVVFKDGERKFGVMSSKNFKTSYKPI